MAIKNSEIKDFPTLKKAAEAATTAAELAKIEEEKPIARLNPEAQLHKVRIYLETHPEGMTSLDAIRRFGCTRLAAVVGKLRQKGYIIESVVEHGENRFGQYVHYARYYFRGYTTTAAGGA